MFKRQIVLSIQMKAFSFHFMSSVYLEDGFEAGNGVQYNLYNAIFF